MPEFNTVIAVQEGAVAHIQLNRPDKANAMNMSMWQDIRNAFNWADNEPTVRAVVLSGNGKHFCAGIDLMDFSSVLMGKDKCEGRKREKLRRLILDMQDCLSSIEKCRKPVLAAVHSAVVGGAIDMITCADMRYASADAYFEIKEIDVGMTADVGTLQRLPHIIGDGMMRELAYTGRRCDAEEACKIGLVNRVYADQTTLLEGVLALANDIAKKSPLAIRGTKEMIKYTRDHSVADSLNHVATWNAGMLISQDIQEAMMAKMQKREPKFED
jgi:enoyl-CoA hydratase